MSDSSEPTDAMKCTACGAGLVAGEPTCSACGAALPGTGEPAPDSAEPTEPAAAPAVGSYRVDDDGQPAEPGAWQGTPEVEKSAEGSFAAWMDKGPVLVVVLKWMGFIALLGMLALVGFFGFVAFMCRIS